MKPPDEEYAKELFQKFLTKHVGMEMLCWKESESPDFYLRVNNTIYALEITALMNKLSKEGINLPIAAMIAVINEIKTRISSLAKSENILDGAFILNFDKAIILNSKEKNKIVNTAIKYIKINQGVAEKQNIILFRKGNTDIKIKKIHSEKQYVETIGPVLTRWEGEVNEEIFSLLQERITTKAKKLKRVDLPKILVLLDRYHIAEPYQYQKVIQNISEKGEFDLIFLVGEESKGVCLYGGETFLSHISGSMM